MPPAIPNSRVFLNQYRFHLRLYTSRALTSQLVSNRETRASISHPKYEILTIRESLLSDTVMKEAEEIDKKIERKEEVGPLTGVLVGVKDNLCIADMPSTGGSRTLEGYRPAYDATAVRKLRERGAILVGKTNLDRFGMGSSTELSGFQFRTLIQKSFKTALNENDLLISPVAPSAGYKLGERQLCWIPSFGFALWICRWWVVELPIGLQIIGFTFREVL